jgi:hypothetical protein
MKLSMFLMCFDTMGISYDIKVLWTPKQTFSHNVTWDLGHVQITLETQNLSCSKHSSLYGIQNFNENPHMLQIQGSHLIIILVYTWAITTHNSNNNHTLIATCNSCSLQWLQTRYNEPTWFFKKRLHVFLPIFIFSY